MKMTKNYLEFLCDFVGRMYEYNLLLAHLHTIEFYAFVPNDDNRGTDGMQLRQLYLDELGPQGSSSLPNGPCTVLEMLIALALRLDFDLSGSHYERSVGEWFWVLIDNLGLEWCDNTAWFATDGAEEVDEKVQIMLDRQYRSDGDGGLFPLKAPQMDQRKVEIWYQMSAWVIENYPI